VLKRIWTWFMKPSTRWGWGPIAILGALGIVIAYNAFLGFSSATSSIEFCTSCHEMRIPYEEYKKSLHYKNRAGVKVECADCHVPRSFFPNLAAKVYAAKDVVGHFLGTLDTPEKFKTERLAMAKRVWAGMQASGSRECRNCHDYSAMNIDEQGRRAKKKHPEGIDQKKTCMDCHKAVVHEMPDGAETDEGDKKPS
jgi:cytochrome c-type protein NapC